MPERPQDPTPPVSGLLRALRRAQLLREREAAALRRRLRGLRPRPPQSMPVPRVAQRPGSSRTIARPGGNDEPLPG
ncbi:hypothetical protein NUM3379_36290 [Kineococcus sp. NUM-3379]